MGKSLLVLFGEETAPDIDSIQTIKRSAYLRSKLQTEKDDRSLDSDNTIGDDEGNYIVAGTKVKILSYRMEDHLFVLVQILEYSEHPYRDESNFKFDPADVV